ncbi:MAG: phage tail sheath subtilisin-like domain-containing protein, partial [Pseudomonadota bacterium]
TALDSIAHKTRAVVIADGPGISDEAAITYRKDFGSQRIYVVAPGVRVWDPTINKNVVRPASPFVAGIINRMDNEQGPWWSPSNKLIRKISGIERPITFANGDTTCAAHRLNENAVTTIIRKDGFKLWGNLTCASDTLWQFLSVVRTNDMIAETFNAGFDWAIDRPFSLQLLSDLENSLRFKLREFKAQGATLGGNVWIDKELNTLATMKAGKLYLDYDVEPPAPMQTLILRAHRNDGYYEDLIQGETV